MSSNSIAYKVVFGNAIPARYDGRCPYTPCVYRGFIRMGQLIARGTEGWGHAECVNTRVHLGTEKADCGTVSDIALRLSDNYHLVTCKKCLKRMMKEALDALQTTLH